MSVSTTVTRIRRYAEIQNTANEKLLVLYPLSLPGNVSAVTLPSRCVVYLFLWKKRHIHRDGRPLLKDVGKMHHLSTEGGD